MFISAIVPAYDEAERIGAVLRALMRAPSIGEVLVVDDGSKDGTAERALAYGVRVLRLTPNQGKAAALDRGVRAARGDVLLFVDADLRGLTPAHVESLVRAYEREKPSVMVVGLMRDGRARTDLAQWVAPCLSGQRVLERGLWELMPRPEALGFGVEVVLPKLARRAGRRTVRVPLHGVTQVTKEEKLGKGRGAVARLRMYGQIARFLASPQCPAEAFPAGSRVSHSGNRL